MNNSRRFMLRAGSGPGREKREGLRESGPLARECGDLGIF